MEIENSNRLELRMLGIDPGLQCTGWGIVVQDGLKLTHLAHGTIRTEATWSFAYRLDKIHNRLIEVIKSALSDLTPREEAVLRLRFGISEPDLESAKRRNK